jgi:hypothetical protein
MSSRSMKSQHQTATSTTHCLTALGGLLAALATGCTQAPNCPALGDCGGDAPVGDWVLAPGHPSCMEDLYIPPADPRLVQATIPSARDPLPEPAVYDWCTLLVTSGGQNIQLRPPRFFYESGQIGTADVRINADGTFTAGLTRTGTFVLDFPALCMREFGAQDNRQAYDPTKSMAVGEPTNVCKQLELPLAQSGLGEGSYRNTRCEPNPADLAGCLCQFDVTETGGPGGFWQQLDKNTLLFIPVTSFPQKVTFCHKGANLQLTGADGDYLFGQKGLRTFDLLEVVNPAPVQPM